MKHYLTIITFIVCLSTCLGCHKQKVNQSETSDDSAIPEAENRIETSDPNVDSPDDVNKDNPDANAQSRTQPEGSQCGSLLCPKGFECEDENCEFYEIGDGGFSSVLLYCGQENGCECGSGVCPKFGFCKAWGCGGCAHGDTNYECFTINTTDPTLRLRTLQEISSDFYPHTGTEEEKYLEKSNHNPEIWNGLPTVTTLFTGHEDGYSAADVICSDPGCDCGGKSLNEGYICNKYKVVLDSYLTSWLMICDKPYKFYGDIRMETCIYSDDVFEQVCNNETGCICGTGRISKGDVCVNGQAQCSTLNHRPGCLCGEQVIDKEYACYQGMPICHAGLKNSILLTDRDKTCSCNGKEIHLGDLCSKDQVICGVNARQTPGCMCGENPLRDGYRCLDNKQYCYCLNTFSKGDDENDSVGDKSCTCQCGKQRIDNGVICSDNNEPVKEKPDVVSERKDNEWISDCGEGAYLLSCGKREVRILKFTPDELNRGAYGLDSQEEYYLDPHNNSEDLNALCSCGTGYPAPGDGYGCAYKYACVGNCPECSCTSERKLAGYQCQKYEGCKCGKERCAPGDLCEKNANGLFACSEFMTFAGTCNGYQHIPIDKISEWGYGCYRHGDKKDTEAEGWYCMNENGCPCGKDRCEKMQMCESSGHCSQNKLPADKFINIEKPVIDLCSFDSD